MRSLLEMGTYVILPTTYETGMKDILNLLF